MSVCDRFVGNVVLKDHGEPELCHCGYLPEIPEAAAFVQTGAPDDETGFTA